MKELSLNILDIAENSTAAGATLVEITVEERPEADLLTITIRDNGRGMDEAFQKAVLDPFTTTRKERKLGLGIPFFKDAAEQAGGSFNLKSTLGKGTTVTAVFRYNHIDRMPLGDMPATIQTLVQCHPQLDFIYTHSYNGRAHRLDTREIRPLIQGLSFAHPEVALWIREHLQYHLNEISLEV